MDHPAATRVLFVSSANDAEVRGVVQSAQQRAFPDGETISVPDLGAAFLNAEPRAKILVLVTDDDALVNSALAAVTADGLPRWAVVVCGNSKSHDADAVSRADFTVPVVAQVLRGALARGRLRREIAQARGDLMAIGTRVVHDLRSPLGGVLTSAEVLKETLVAERPDHGVLTDSIVESVEGQMRLIRQLSVLAKSSAQVHVPEKFNMRDPFWSAVQQVEKLSRLRNVKIEQPSDWPDAMGSPLLTEGVWQHLLANAIVHSGSAPKVAAGWERAGADVRFWVRSNAAIPPIKRSSLFTPFNLLHQTNAPRGWGLSIIRRLVELQGGKCGYEATDDQGSCFYFTLPTPPGP